MKMITPQGWVYGTDASLAGMPATPNPGNLRLPLTTELKVPAIFRCGEHFKRLTQTSTPR